MSGAVSVARSVSLTIPGIPAYSWSPNSRTHWRVRHQEALVAKWRVREAIDEQFGGFPPEFRGPVRLHWTVYLSKGGKRRDPDNVLPCFKPFCDQLVFAGVILGDSPTFIPKTPTVEQIVWSQHKGDPRIVVTIEEATR